MRTIAVLDDQDVERLPAGEVVAAIRSALRHHGEGRLRGPARLSVAVGGDRELVFTVGGGPEVAGFRVYGTADGQVTAVWRDGRLAGVITGDELGDRRTAAIGAVAADVLSPPGASVLGLVGPGAQGLHHVGAVAAVRRLREVRLYGRDPDRREATAERLRRELGLPVLAAPTAEDAVAGADLVTLATTSGTPVVDAEAIRHDAHVTTIGPKFAGRHELPLEVVERAAAIVTDSLDQVDHYPEPFMLAGTRHHERMLELGALVAGRVAWSRRPGDLSLFVSVGLAGTEPYLAAAVLDAARA